MPSWSQDRANMERQGRAKMAKLEPRWHKRPPRWSQDGQLGAKMEPILAKSEPRWPKRAPRWSQDGQVGAKMEPTWLQDVKDASTWADIVPILKKLHFPLVFLGFRSPRGASGCRRERATVRPRRSSWRQDGFRIAKESAKMAKLEPKRSQHDSKMAQNASRWSQESAKM